MVVVEEVLRWSRRRVMMIGRVERRRVVVSIIIAKERKCVDPSTSHVIMEIEWVIRHGGKNQQRYSDQQMISRQTRKSKKGI